MSTQLTGLSQKVFLDRYSLKDADGNSMETTPEEMWKRVAKGISDVEPKNIKALWRKKFYNVMKDFKFLPGGRIFAGAGTGYDVTYYNCFVIPSPKDSRDGILDNLKSMIEIMARGGGVGLNLSSLRPRGARVKKVNGFSSGPINWAELYSLATKDIVQQGGSRRGALMLMLHDWHPDVEEFITVKQDLTRINGANLSVCLSDAFMEAVKKDADWDLCYPDLDDPQYDEKWDGDLVGWKAIGGKVKVQKTIKASYLWNLICTAAWQSAEPGLHFLERSNKRSNTYYFEKLIATNPSLRAGTKVLTQEGIFPIEKLEGKKFLVKNLDGKWSSAECFLSGKDKPLYKLTLSNGEEIFATAEHKWPVALRGGGFGKVTTNNLQAGNILPYPKGDDLTFSSKKTLSRGEGLMVGWLYGDGWISERGASLLNLSKSGIGPSQLYNYSTPTVSTDIIPSLPVVSSPNLHAAIGMKSKKVFGFLFSEEDKIMASPILDEINKLKKELSSLTKAHDNTYTIQSTSALFAENLESLYGVDKKESGFPSAVWISGGDFIKGFIDGLISSDGFISKNSYRIIFTTKHQKLANDFSTLLSFYGIKSHIRRSEATKVKFPNQKEYSKIYARFDVSIEGFNAVQFGKIFRLSHPRKQQLLDRIVSEHSSSRALPDHEVIRIKSVELTDIKEDVWDISVFDETHTFYIGHCVTGNCGEQPLSAWAVCNLGAMNLVAYVKPARHASQGDAGGNGKFEFDYDAFGKDVQVATRFLDDVIDATYYFLDENEKCAKDIRRTGLGIMGLGDALIMMKLRYGAEESLPTIEKIFKTLRDNAYIASSDLAKEKGSFPKFDKDKYLEAFHVKVLPKAIKDRIAKNGIRNAVLLTIAPTGTTSLLAGTTSGIEPVYEFEFIRKSRLGVDKLYHPLYDAWRKEHPEEARPEYFVSANDLTPMDHAKVQAIAQGYIDSSISKTVNAPNKDTVEDVKELYMAAYDMGMKGITYMRDGSRQGVLSREDLPAGEAGKKEEVPVGEELTVKKSPILRRPVVMKGLTYKTQTPLGDAFVTINSDDNNNPFEMFITIGKSGSDVAAMADALGRIISLVLRLQSPIEPRERVRQVIAQLSGIGGVRSVGFGPNRVRSVPDAMAKVLAEEFHFKVNGRVVDVGHEVNASDANGHSNGNGYVTNGLTPVNADTAPQEVIQHAVETLGESRPQMIEQLPLESAETNAHADVCPMCGDATFVHEEGCSKCYSCGHAEC